MERKESDYGYKPMEGPDIVLDFSHIRYLGEVHRELKEKFGFPDYYGENWPALWDCMRDMFYEAGEWNVRIRGYDRMPKELREGCRVMLEIFDEVHKDTPNVHFYLE